MFDLTCEGPYRGAWDNEPLQTAIALTMIKLHVAEDCFRAIDRLADDDNPPVFAHLPVARCALESVAAAYYLSAPGVDLKERVRRSLNERLLSESEVLKLPQEILDRRPSGSSADRIREAVAVGYALTANGAFLAPGPPTVLAKVQTIVGDDDLGRVIYSKTSAVAHATSWGAFGFVKRVPGGGTELADSRALLTTNADDYIITASYLADAYLTACEAVLAYVGWLDDQWTLLAAEISDQLPFGRRRR